MEYGVFSSTNLEIAQTMHWTLCFFCNPEKSLIGAKLYYGSNDNKSLTAICERYLQEKKTVYAYKSIDGINVTNDYNGVCKLIGSPFTYEINGLKKKDSIILSDPYELATVDERGIGFCLKQWRLGTSYVQNHDSFTFLMVTNKIEYVFSIQTQHCNIYCGASVNIPYENGMFGGGQYYRFRNFDDNSQPFCGFSCNLGNDLIVPTVSELKCESGACIVTDKGLYWPVKRFTNDEIVLHGCGDDEYIYNRNSKKSEFFAMTE